MIPRRIKLKLEKLGICRFPYLDPVEKYLYHKKSVFYKPYYNVLSKIYIFLGLK